MDWNLKITDMAGATPEHSSVIVNFVAAVRYQLKNSTCYVYSDNVQYRFKDAEGNNKIVIPDASINCRTKSRRGNTAGISGGYDGDFRGSGKRPNGI